MFPWPCALHQPGKSFLFTSSSYLWPKIPPLLLVTASPCCVFPVNCLSAVDVLKCHHLHYSSDSLLLPSFNFVSFFFNYRFQTTTFLWQVSVELKLLSLPFHNNTCQCKCTTPTLILILNFSIIWVFLSKCSAPVEVRLQQALFCV